MALIFIDTRSGVPVLTMFLTAARLPIVKELLSDLCPTDRGLPRLPVVLDFLAAIEKDIGAFGEVLAPDLLLFAYRIVQFPGKIDNAGLVIFRRARVEGT
jgi:hypothetical protein